MSWEVFPFLADAGLAPPRLSGAWQSSSEAAELARIGCQESLDLYDVVRAGGLELLALYRSSECTPTRERFLGVMRDDGTFLADAGFRDVGTENGLPCLAQSTLGVHWVHSGGAAVDRMATIVPIRVAGPGVTTLAPRVVPRPANTLWPYFPQCLNDRSQAEQGASMFTLLTAADSSAGQVFDPSTPEGSTLFALELGRPDGG